MSLARAMGRPLFPYASMSNLYFSREIEAYLGPVKTQKAPFQKAKVHVEPPVPTPVESCVDEDCRVRGAGLGAVRARREPTEALESDGTRCEKVHRPSHHVM